MYGKDDTILYTFQSQDNDYILMANVNWKKKPELPQSIKSLNRPYSLIYPFETMFPNNTAIKVVPYEKNVPINLDNPDIIK